MGLWCIAGYFKLNEAFSCSQLFLMRVPSPHGLTRTFRLIDLVKRGVCRKESAPPGPVRDRQRNDVAVEDFRHGHLQFGGPCGPLFSRRRYRQTGSPLTAVQSDCEVPRIVQSRVGYWPQAVLVDAPKRSRCWSSDNAARFGA